MPQPDAVTLRFPAYAPLIEPARPSRALWRVLLGAPFAIGIYATLLFGLGALIAVLSGLSGLDAQLRRLQNGSDPWSVIYLLATFVAGWLGTWAALRLLHGRGLGSVLGRAPRVVRDFLRGAVLMLGVSAVATLIARPWLPPLEQALPLESWLWFLPLALVGLLIQTGAEELFFRGYLQSQLAARFASPLIWMILPSVLFGFAHYTPDTGGTGLVWLVLAATGLFGLVAADLTARSGSLGLAWGLHFANNFLAILMVSIMGGLDGLALFRLTEPPATGLAPLLIADMALMGLVWALCRLDLRRR